MLQINGIQGLKKNRTDRLKALAGNLPKALAGNMASAIFPVFPALPARPPGQGCQGRQCQTHPDPVPPTHSPLRPL
jgi:hypothetical protein